MERIKVSFVSSDDTFESKLEAYINHNHDLFIQIVSDNEYNNAFIVLNIETAIKLVKHLKKQISLVKQGGQNG